MNIWMAVFLLAAACVRAEEEASPARIEMHKAVDRLLPSNAVNVVTLDAPRALALRELGLEGIKEGVAIMVADEVRIFSGRNVLDARPAVRIWRNAREGGRWWYQTGGTGSAEDHVIQPGQAVVVVTRGSERDIAWTNPLIE